MGVRSRPVWVPMELGIVWDVEEWVGGVVIIFGLFGTFFVR